jgi:putative hydrolase of the HAD superfamily
MKRTIRAVIFDLDGTLYDERGGMQRALARTVAEGAAVWPGLDPERATQLYPEVGRSVWERAELYGPGNPKGSTTEQLRAEVWTALLLAIDGNDPAQAADAGRQLAAIYTAARRAGHRLFEESRDVLASLDALVRGGRLERIAMITNGPSDLQREKLAACGLDGRFDPLVISAEAGRVKPDPRIFLDAVSACGCDPGEAIYVGDNPELDIGGGAGAGLVTAWINRFGDPFPAHLPAADHEMSTLHPLLSLLGGADSR